MISSKTTSRTWVEKIDHRAHVACCVFEEVWRGRIFSASAILLFDPTRRSARYMAIDAVVAKLREEVVSGIHCRHPTHSSAWLETHNKMPLIGMVRDLRR